MRQSSQYNVIIISMFLIGTIGIGYFFSFVLFDLTENSEQNTEPKIEQQSEHPSRFAETHLYPIKRTNDEEHKEGEEVVSLNNLVTEVVPREEQAVSSPALSLGEVTEEIIEDTEDQVAEKIKELEVKYANFREQLQQLSQQNLEIFDQITSHEIERDNLFFRYSKQMKEAHENGLGVKVFELGQELDRLVNNRNFLIDQLMELDIETDKQVREIGKQAGAIYHEMESLRD